MRARDEDRHDVLIYSLSGTDAAAFDIDPRTGQLWTKAVLDPAVKDTYTVTVEVRDGFDASYTPSSEVDATIDVTITVAPPRPPGRNTPTSRPAPDPEPETTTGGGTSIALVLPVPAPEPAPAVDFQPVEQLFQETEGRWKPGQGVEACA